MEKILTTFAWISFLAQTCYGDLGELELLENLFEKNGYNKLIRPVSDPSKGIEVGFQIALSQIIHLDQRNQVMKTNVWLQMEWNDFQLRWDPEEYGTTTIRITPDNVWTPDIILFNNADGVYEHSYDSNVVVSHTGYIYWIPPAIFESSCSIDVEFFPFDQQECEMYFGSWSYNVQKMNFTFYHKVSIADVSDYSKSGTWIILDVSSYIKTMRKQGTNEDIAIFVVHFTLRRMTLFYMVNLIIPCVMISFASISVFVLPAEALFVINQNFRTPRTHQMPRWVRLFFLNYLPRIMRMKRPDHEERWQNPEDDIFDFPSPDLQPATTNRRVAFGDLRDTHHPGCKVLKMGHVDDGKTIHKIEHSEECRRRMIHNIHSGAYQAADAIHFLKQHIEKEEKFETILDDWRYVATVLDRFLFYVYLFVTCCGTVVILMKAPYIFDPKDQDEILDQMLETMKEQSAY
ncbi:hypothetical protein ScPMuIL_018246 [Solemya velum]